MCVFVSACMDVSGIEIKSESLSVLCPYVVHLLGCLVFFLLPLVFWLKQIILQWLLICHCVPCTVVSVGIFKLPSEIV